MAPERGKRMVIEFYGRDEWSEYLKAVEAEDQVGGTASPGTAGALLGVSRQRIQQIVDSFPDVRAWLYYERKGRQSAMYEVSVRDLLRWAVRSGRIQSEEDLRLPWARAKETLREVLHSETSVK